MEIFLKKVYNIDIPITIHFKQYLHSFIQSTMFTVRVARQTNGLYVLHKIVKLAYCLDQSIEVDTHNFLSKINRFLLILLIDEKLNFGINTAFYPWYHVLYQITRLLQQMD